MTYLAWTTADPADGLGDGPWTEVFHLGPGLFAVHSDHTRSQVYHALKDALPDGAPLLVAELDRAPKAKGLAPGAAAWWRAHHADPGG